MREIMDRDSQKPIMEKRSGRADKLVLSLLMVIFGFSMISAQQFKLFRTPKNGNTVTLTKRAKIVRITRTPRVKSFSIWRNGRAYVTINRLKLNERNSVVGVLPPGTYVLRVLGGSVSVFLNTNYVPFNVILWARQNKLVKPLWDGNLVVLTTPTKIVNATYNGTKGMGIFVAGQRRAFFHYLSPHNSRNRGPKVLNSTGRVVGKTLVGLTLPMGVYSLVPGQGPTDGIVNGQVVLKIR